VEAKVLVKKPSLTDSIGNFFSDLKKKMGGLRTSGSYVLQ